MPANARHAAWLIVGLIVGTVALADTLYKQGTTVLGPVNIVQCGDGITCFRDGGQVTVQTGLQYWFDAGVGASSRYPSAQFAAPFAWIYSPYGISLPDGGPVWFDSQRANNPWAAGIGSPSNPPIDTITIANTATADGTGNPITGNIATPTIGFVGSVFSTRLGQIFGSPLDHNVSTVPIPPGGTTANTFSLRIDGGTFTWGQSLGNLDGGTSGFGHGINVWPALYTNFISSSSASGNSWAETGQGAWSVSIGASPGQNTSIANPGRTSIMRINARSGGDAVSFTNPFTYLHLGAGARIWSAATYCPEPGACTRPAGYSEVYSTPVITMAPVVSIPILTVGRLFLGSAPSFLSDGGLSGTSGSFSAQARTTWVSDGGTVAAQSNRVEWIIFSDVATNVAGANCVANSNVPQTAGIVHTCDILDAGSVAFTFHNYTSGVLAPAVGTYSALVTAP